MDAEDSQDDLRAEQPATERQSTIEEAQQQVELIGEEFLDGLRHGEHQSLDEVVGEHQDLQPQLEGHLKIIEAVYAATHRSSEKWSTQDSSGHLPGSLEQTQNDSGFYIPPEPTVRVRCPHCGHGLQLVGRKVQEITCRSCGSEVHIDGELVRKGDGISHCPKRLGRFSVERLLGQGAFGSVYLADDPTLGRKVAIKVPRRGYFSSPEEEQRFYREAKSVSRLSHPNIVPVHEISDDRETPFIVSEYIDGVTLGDIASANVLTFRETVEFMVQIARAVDYAHQNNVIHRDLKPSNILVDGDRQAYVVDFGLARRDDIEITMTVEGVILGTPAYMSAEQASGKLGPVDARSDVYSMGVILYRLLCRELPFNGTKRMLIHQVIHDDPRSPRRINEHIPVDLDTITLRAMAKEPFARFQSAGEMADELERWLRNEPIKSRPISSLMRLSRWCQRHPMIASLSSVIGLLLLSTAIMSLIWANREKGLRNVAVENAVIATDNKNQSDARLYRLMRQNGLNSLQRNDLTQSAFWFASAIEITDSRLNRTRLGMIQDRIPKLVNLLKFDSPLSAIKFNQDGTRIAVGCQSGLVRVIDRASGETLLEKRTDGIPVYGLQIFPAGDKIVFRSDFNNVQIWDIDTKALVKTLGHPDLVQYDSIDVNDSGDIVTGCDDSILRIWNAADGALKTQVKFEGKQIDRVRFVSGSTRIVAVVFDSGSKADTVQITETDQFPNQVHVWDYQAEQFIGETIRTERQIIHLDSSPDHKRLATATRANQVRVWDLESGDPIGTPIQLPNLATRVFFGNDPNRLVTMEANGDVTTWDLENASRTDSKFRTDGSPGLVAMDPKRRLLAQAETDGTLKIFWSANGLEATTSLRNGNEITSVEFHSNGRQLAVGGANGILQIWDLAGAMPTMKVFPHDDEVRNAVFTKDGKRCLTIGLDGKAFIWNVESGVQVAGPLIHEDGINECAASPDGRMFATASSDEKVKVWDAITGTQIGSEYPHGSQVVQVAFSPDSKTMVAGCFDGTVNGWSVTANVKAPQPLFTINHQSRIERVVFNSIGDLVASVGFDGSIRCSDAATGVPKFGPLQHQQRANDCEFLPDGKRLVSCAANGSVWIWDLATATVEQKLKCSMSVNAIAVNSDGWLITSDFAGESRIWKEVDGKFEIGMRTQHPITANVNYSQTNSDRTLLAFGGGWAGLDQKTEYRGAAIIWDIEDDSLFCPPLLHLDSVRRLHFDSGGNHLLTASSDHTARLFSMENNDLPVADAKRIAGLYGQLDEITETRVKTMSSSKMASEFAELSKTYPNWFACDSDDIKNWNDYLVRLDALKPDSVNPSNE